MKTSIIILFVICVQFNPIRSFRSFLIQPRNSINNHIVLRSKQENDLSIPSVNKKKIISNLASFIILISPQASFGVQDNTLFNPVATEVAYSQGSSPTVSIQSAENQLIQLFEQSTASVVNINTFIEQINAYSMNIMEVPQGTGSGFIWDKDGHIVTNFHVIRNANSAKVTLLGPNGVSQTYTAHVQGIDPDKDIAVLSIDIPNPKLLKPISVGTSTNLRVGQSVLAIGNPFGLDHTLTTGIISGVGREVRSPSNRPINNVIQTDAAINPGNSGGPLLDSNGRLIGMNTAIFSPSGASAGIGFAIPVDTLKYVVDTLIREGRVVRPAIGISYLESSQAKFLGIEKGVLVLDVPAGSPGDRAGLKGTTSDPVGGIQLGDIIVAIDSNEISSEADLFKALDKYKVGDTVTITALRSIPAVQGQDNNLGQGFGAKMFKTEEVKLKLTLDAKRTVDE